MARVASLAVEVGADIKPLERHMRTASDSVERFARRSRESSRRAAAGMEELNRASGRMRSSVQNAAFQIGDFAVQVNGGTSAMRAASQQLPQLLGGFGAMGAVAGAAFAALSPLVSKLVESSDATFDANSALGDLQGSMSDIKSEVRDLTSLQQTLNQATRDQGDASASATRAVMANTKRQFDVKRQLLQVNLQLIQFDRREAEVALENLRAQQENARVIRMEQLRNLGPGATFSALDATGGFAGPGPTQEDILKSASISPEEDKAFKQRQRDILELEQALLKLDETGRLAQEALQGVFADPSAPEGTSGGASRGPGSRTPMEEAIVRQKDALHELLEATEKSLDMQLGAWGNYFSSLAALSQSGSEKLLRISKAFGAASALVNAWKAHNEVLQDPLLPWWQRTAAAAYILSAGLGAVNAIKAVSAGGGGSAAASGGGAAAAPAQQDFSNATVQLFGSETATYSKDQLAGLFNAINEGIDDGYRIRLV